ncbi:MAG TPA: hypothetical protein VIY73_23455 [Polyangiaceae bacterium]
MSYSDFSSRDRSTRSAFLGLTSLALLGLALTNCSLTAKTGNSDGKGDDSDAGTKPACDDSNPCASGTCCGNTCVDTTQDPGNCGSCGSACSGGQFCTASACTDGVITNACANGDIAVVQDQYDVDNTAGSDIGQALATCNGGGSGMSTVAQSASIFVPEGDGGARPDAGGNTTLVVGGGWWGQAAVAYLDGNGITPVYFTNDGTTSVIYERSTGAQLATAADSTLTANHDFFIEEMVVEPESGTPCFIGYGLYNGGTEAAGYYAANELVPNHGSYTDSWYVYEWTDANLNGSPDSADTFKLVDSGR